MGHTWSVEGKLTHSVQPILERTPSQDFHTSRRTTECSGLQPDGGMFTVYSVGSSGMNVGENEKLMGERERERRGKQPWAQNLWKNTKKNVDKEKR